MPFVCWIESISTGIKTANKQEKTFEDITDFLPINISQRPNNALILVVDLEFNSNYFSNTANLYSPTSESEFLLLTISPFLASYHWDAEID